jgi:S1-C subfamily serine protease
MRNPWMISLAGVALATSTAGAAPLDSDQISDTAEKVVLSVVNVATTKQVDSDFGPFGNEQPQSALGSGVIVTEKGRILTNAHVVNGADSIEVTLSDGDTYDAKVVGIDKMSDLAVLQLQGDVPSLPAIDWGKSSKLRLGQVVLAIGDPFGVGQAVTMGIVSAKGRAGLGIEDYEDFIQTDAAINPGNSGGALVDLDGNLVGINTAIASQSGGYDGIGFAIPSDMAQPIMDMLVKDGKVSRGYIGVTLAPLTPDWKKEHEVTVKKGVGVDGLLDDGPAAKAGLEVGDVITAIDDAAITDLAHLRNTIAMKGGDAKLELTVMRGKDKVTLEMRTKLMPDDGLKPDPTPKKAKPAKAEKPAKKKHEKAK